MPPKPLGDRAMTGGERRALHYQRQKAQAEQWRTALERIATARTIREAREIAAESMRKPTETDNGL